MDGFQCRLSREPHLDFHWPRAVCNSNILQTRLLNFFHRYHQSLAVAGSTNGKWKHYSFLYRVQLPGYNWISNPSHMRVMLEETGRTGSNCGHALFDNVVVKEAKVCSKGITTKWIYILIK